MIFLRISYFSPNFDGINDLFRVYAASGVVKEIKKYAIYDRWGEALFANENFALNSSGNWWDGTFRGETLNPGVYIYYIEVEFTTDHLKKYSGAITLME